jgi:ABC-type polysaccharide/polyol phosphate export permease
MVPDAAPGSARGPRATLRAVIARSEAPSSLRSSSIRPGSVELVRIGIRDVLSRRRLIAYLVRADLKKKGADTLLGNIWWIIDPLLQMLVYVVLVAVILRTDIADYPLFVFCAILPWKWFSTTVNDGVTSVSLHDKLIKQINFPKLVLPFAAVIAGIVNFAFGMIPLLGLSVLFYADRLSPWILLIPVIAISQLVFSLAVATVLAGCNVFYRDVGNLARHLLRFWFYLSPALYGSDKIAEITKNHAWVGPLFAANPWTTLFNAYRDVIYNDRAPDWVALGAVTVVSAVLLALAILFFKRVEPTFAKVL